MESKKILVIDDDPTIIKIVESCLTKEGYEIVSTTEAAEGLQLAMNDSPDLIVLDVMMPIINGFNICKMLRSEDSSKDIPVVLLTSRDEKDDIEIGLEMGANAYLTKPVNTEELLKTINLIIQ